MYPLRCLLFLTAAVILIACAGGSAPPPERQPEDLHRSIRYLNRGTTFYTKGCFTKAAYQFQKAHELFTAADNLQGAADSLNSLANAYYRLNEMPSAVLVYDEAATYYRLVADRVGEVRALSNKSAALSAAGQFSEAKAALDRADTSAGDEDLLYGQRMKARAILKIKTRDFVMARQLLSKAMKAIPRTDTGQYASAQYTMGVLLLASGNHAEAAPYLLKALEVDQNTESYYSIAQDLETLGDCHAKMEQHAQAVSYYKRSIKIFALLDDADKVGQISDRLSLSASNADLDIRATLHWVKQWLAGQWEIGICR